MKYAVDRYRLDFADVVVPHLHNVVGRKKIQLLAFRPQNLFCDCRAKIIDYMKRQPLFDDGISLLHEKMRKRSHRVDPGSPQPYGILGNRIHNPSEHSLGPDIQLR